MTVPPAIDRYTPSLGDSRVPAEDPSYVEWRAFSLPKSGSLGETRFGRAFSMEPKWYSVALYDNG